MARTAPTVRAVLQGARSGQRLPGLRGGAGLARGARRGRARLRSAPGRGLGRDRGPPGRPLGGRVPTAHVQPGRQRVRAQRKRAARAGLVSRARSRGGLGRTRSRWGASGCACRCTGRATPGTTSPWRWGRPASARRRWGSTPTRWAGTGGCRGPRASRSTSCPSPWATRTSSRWSTSRRRRCLHRLGPYLVASPGARARRERAARVRHGRRRVPRARVGAGRRAHLRVGHERVRGRGGDGERGARPGPARCASTCPAGP